MRRDEAFRLTWADIDVIAKTISVRPEKGSNPRILKISDKLFCLMCSLQKNAIPNPRERVFAWKRKIYVGFASPPDWLKAYDCLSQGEKMRVDVARALCLDKPLMVFDEFTSVVEAHSLHCRRLHQNESKILPSISIGCSPRLPRNRRWQTASKHHR